MALHKPLLKILTLGLLGCTVGMTAQTGSVVPEAKASGLFSSSNADEQHDVWDRIRAGYGVPEVDPDRVQRWVEFYAKDPKYVRRMADRASKYLYNIVEEVEARKMPTEIALLPFVESAFHPEALSTAKAVGLWQFMPSTGEDYDLAQNLWRDDRRDVLESTRAALDYFQYLYNLFGDWQLALAAYNWGEGNVKRAIARNKAKGLPTDYEHLRMPNETRNYVPKLLAIKQIIQDPGKYGIELPDIGNEPFFVRITKPRDIDLKTAAELAGIPLEEFRRLNPSYKLPVIVASHNNVMLLPADRVDYFIDNLASWMDSGQPLSRWATYRLKKGETLSSVAKRFDMTEAELRKVNQIPQGRQVLPNSTLLVQSNGDDQTDISAEEADARLRLSPQTTWRRVVYRVRSGDTLSAIARRWHITTKSIASANRLRNDRLSVGQRLILTVPNVGRAPIIRVASSANPHIIYTVRPGDSIQKIANRYGVTVASLKSTNRLKSNVIRAGQRLRIPKKGAAVNSDVQIYIVRAGDTLSTIAQRFDVDVKKLARNNRLTSSALRVGQRLEIPDSVVQMTSQREVEPTTNATRVYQIRSGDSLGGIAKRFGVSTTRLKQINGLRSNTIHAGQTLLIPVSSNTHASRTQTNKKVVSHTSARTYKVRSGDTLSEIAQKHKISVQTLKKLNGLKSNAVRVGQVLRVK